MSKDLLTIIIIACAILAVGSLAYSIYSAIQTNKKNKATDEANQRMFLARNQQYINSTKSENKSQFTQKVPAYIANPIIKELEKPKELDYDSVDEEIIETDKRLKDFFKAD